MKSRNTSSFWKTSARDIVMEESVVIAEPIK
jgi:hypothetical protein